MGNVAIAFVFRIGLTTSASSSPKSVNAVSKEGIVEQITPTSVSVRVQKSGCNGFCDDEIYGQAIHYYEEKDIYVQETAS